MCCFKFKRHHKYMRRINTSNMTCKQTVTMCVKMEEINTVWNIDLHTTLTQHASLSHRFEWLEAMPMSIYDDMHHDHSTESDFVPNILFATMLLVTIPLQHLPNHQHHCHYTVKMSTLNELLKQTQKSSSFFKCFIFDNIFIWLFATSNVVRLF